MAPRSPVSLADLLRTGPLLTPSQRAELDAVLQAHGGDPRTLMGELVRRGWLTPFQADHLLHGRGGQLILGPYVLLDRLGEGGMGSIFKARHALMERVVALKVIRTDRLSSPDAVARFHREIKALARLSHPHVVLAHDAAQAGATHFLVMEYIEGTDLARLLGERGFLPVAQACDYIRQAALGLQHAHEHGLVHRDIKPANLLVTTKGVVKLLDLGLARLRPALQAENGDGALTAAGSVMGTPDYLAPEQADDASRADIRADIYSLGCTLYHLLSGQPPFPGGSLSQKLLRHQQARPADLRTLRPEVSPALAAIVQKMMAKRPHDRPSTPAEIAAALEPFCPSSSSPPSSTITLARPPESDVPTEPAAGNGSPPRWRRRALLLGAAVTLVLIVAAIVFLRAFFRSGEPLPASVIVQLIGLPRADDPNFALHLDGRPIALEDLRRPIELRVGDHELVVVRDGVVVARHAFTVALADDQKTIALPEADAEVGELRCFLGHTQYVFSVAFSGDGTRILSAGLASDQGGNSRGEVLLWDVDSPRSLRRLLSNRWVRAVALSADGRRALCGSFNSKVGSVIVWDLEAGKELRHFDGHRHTPHSVAFSPDETRALSADHPRGALKGVTRLWSVGDGKELQSFEGNLACFSRDSRRILTARDTVLLVWDAETGKELLRFKEATGQVMSVAFSPDGLLALSAGDGMARLWDATTGTVLRTFKARTGQVYSAAFSPDGRRVLTGGEDKMVRLWDVATGQELHCFEGHEREVRSVAFSPGGRRAVSGSFDKTVRLWSLPK